MEACNHTHLPLTPVPATSANTRKCILYNIPRIFYTEALKLQHDLHARCAAREIPGALILLEHDPVVTTGVKTTLGNVLLTAAALRKRGVELVETDRGGDATYHGPGQLVGYPILRLGDIGADLHGYLRALEQSVIHALSEYGLKGRRNGPAGVWVGDKKICSIGIAVRKHVTYHGFALNVNPHMSHFAFINPCGLSAAQITSMFELLGTPPDMADVREVYARSFAGTFGLDLECPSGETR